MLINIFDVLKNTSVYEPEMYDVIMNGDVHKRIPALRRIIKSITGSVSEMDSDKLVEILCEAFSDYIKAYPAPNAYREKIWKRFIKWIKNVIRFYGLNYDEDYISENLVCPVQKNSVIEIIKMLHVYDEETIGISKSEIVNGLQESIGERSVKDIINRLSIDGLKRDKSAKPIVIAGQTVSLNIKHRDRLDDYTEKNSRSRYFYSTSTVNPIFMQLNISQVYLILHGLARTYMEEERQMAISSGMEIWSQLSQYTQQRIRIVYFNPKNTLYDKDLDEFIQIVEDEMKDDALHTYVTERQLIDSGELSTEEEWMLEEKLQYRM